MKTIVIGVTSSISCYKVVGLIQKLKKSFNIEVIMSSNAEKLINRKEFEKVLGKKVHVSMFYKGWNYKDYIKRQKSEHISLADKADLFALVPATANVIGKIANGYADDLLTTSIMATNAPVLICPAMNCKMWGNKIVKSNVSKLRKVGYFFVEPEKGKLACGYSGVGRLAGMDKIAGRITSLLSEKKDLENKNIIVTAGPTQEEIDPVRIITNKSSGKLGYAIAEAAVLRGAKVILISGPVNLDAPFGVNFVSVKTAEDMRKAVLKYYGKTNAVIMAAAVSDFKVKRSKEKIKKKDSLVLKLIKNIDILKELGKKKRKQKLIGFALETKDLVKNALKKLKEKNLDVIVANNAKTLSADKADFILIDKKNKRKFLNISKRKIANKILDLIR